MYAMIYNVKIIINNKRETRIRVRKRGRRLVEWHRIHTNAISRINQKRRRYAPREEKAESINKYYTHI